MKGTLLRYAANTGIWLVVCFLSLGIGTATKLSEDLTSLIGLVIPSLVLAFFRSKTPIPTALTVLGIFSIAYVYHAMAGIAYAHAVGYVFGSGVIGLLFVAVLNWLLKGKIKENTDGFRRYALGMLLFTPIGIPLSMQNAEAEAAHNAKLGAAGREIGYIYGACDMIQYAKAKHCPSIELKPEMARTCGDIRSNVPEYLMTEYDQLLGTQQFNELMMNNRRLVDDSVLQLPEQEQIEAGCAMLSSEIHKGFTTSITNLKKIDPGK